MKPHFLALREGFPKDDGTMLSQRGALRGVHDDDDDQTWKDCGDERRPLDSLDNHWLQLHRLRGSTRLL